MNDRYLFRGKRDNKRHTHNLNELIVGTFQYKENAREYLIWYDRGGITDYIYVDPKTIGQCTGLKDKNGVLYYEGDKYIGCDGELYIIDDMHGFCCFEDAESCEIIGNIHEDIK